MQSWALFQLLFLFDTFQVAQSCKLMPMLSSPKGLSSACPDHSQNTTVHALLQLRTDTQDHSYQNHLRIKSVRKLQLRTLLPMPQLVLRIRSFPEIHVILICHILRIKSDSHCPLVFQACSPWNLIILLYLQLNLVLRCPGRPPQKP